MCGIDNDGSVRMSADSLTGMNCRAKNSIESSGGNSVMGRIITVTLNPCMDKTIEINGLKTGGTNKVIASRTDIGGKGINVSTVLHQLGYRTSCIGFDFIQSGSLVGETLRERGIPCNLISVDGFLRTNMKVFDTSNGVMTEFNETGCPVETDELHLFLAAIDELLAELDPDSMIVLDGSVPPGIPADIYRTIIEKARLHGIRTILDASGDVLMQAIKAIPFAVKPNIDEMAQLAGEKLESAEEIAAAARILVQKGIRYVCVSMGAMGAVLVSDRHTYYAEAPDVTVRGIQGAGDSMVAGICMAVALNLPEEKILAYASAAAGGSVLHEGTQLCESADFEDLSDKCKVRILG